MPDNNTRWENDKEWAEWTIRDEIYGVVRQYVGPIVVAAIGSLAGTIWSFVAQYKGVAIALGGSSATFASILILALINWRKRTARAALSSPKESPRPEPPTRLPIAKAALNWAADTLNAIPESLPAPRKINPAPTEATLSEEQRRRFMTLYAVDAPKNLVWLKFLPHTQSRDLDSLILILYGYRTLANKTEVPIPWLSKALVESRCLPELNTVRIWQITTGNESGRLDVDAVARGGRPYLTLLNLARGGEYQLTEVGIAKGRDLANELIENA